MTEEMLYGILNEAGIYFYIIAGIGVSMIIFRFLAYSYLQHVARSAREMGKTKNRYLKSVKNAYDKELLRHEQVDNVSIFVERELTRLRFLGMSVNMVGGINVQGMLLVVTACILGMAQCYYEEWDALTGGILIIFTLVTFVILLSLENLVRIDDVENVIEIHIIDYLENNIKSDILMGERNQEKKERSMLLAHQLETQIERKLQERELAAGRQDEPEGKTEPIGEVQMQQGEKEFHVEQEKTFLEMLNEFFV